MLVELRIQNFAIIDNLELELGDGLTILTGETGAGKSILFDAVETLLGVRADTTIIRHGEERAVVEGVFSLEGESKDYIKALMAEEELVDDSDFLTISREFRRNGRNIVRINGNTVNLNLIKLIGHALIDLHGQSEHLSLLRVESHLTLLDRFADIQTPLSSYQTEYAALQKTRKELAALKKAEKDAAQKADMFKFQVNEIFSADLQEDEEDALKEERNRLANAEKLTHLINLAISKLDDSTPEMPAISDQFGDVLDALENLQNIDPSQAENAATAQTISDMLADLTKELRLYIDEIEFNGTRLEEVEERLAMIQDLKRKYGATISEVLAFAENAQNELETITHAEERIAILTQQEQTQRTSLAQLGMQLAEIRHAAALQLSEGIEAQLHDLRMEKARFMVEFTTHPDPNGLQLAEGDPVAFDDTGFEKIEFMVETNPGEGFKPLVKVASGGETSRLMLGLKNVLAKADHTPTLIFDEIDQGIGGRVGAMVGQKLWHLGQTHQVLCITHLAQLAGYGSKHYHVRKLVQEGRTSTEVISLTGNDRLMELAQMLGDVSAGTLQSANEILQSVEEYTQSK